MDLCVQWKEMCQQSKFLQDKCPRTCGTCAPGRSKINHIDLYLNASKILGLEFIFHDISCVNYPVYFLGSHINPMFPLWLRVNKEYK